MGCNVIIPNCITQMNVFLRAELGLIEVGEKQIFPFNLRIHILVDDEFVEQLTASQDIIVLILLKH